MAKYNVTIQFNQEHLKPVFYTGYSEQEFRTIEVGVSIHRLGEPSIIYPWSSIYKFQKELVEL